uniref:NADH dehydrogenase subunit 6 n=1 Tax=Bannacoris arboreus TaxID=1837149 RepID=A0A2P1CMJ4_9HEMI|nr:NADH dehydrogenase subunit 6 [Bannacoris arboreus]AVJ52563.1 NADH dehydrogenase subunit 6 [Bannacoris arboreus]WEM32392.1 NADH dehydrogenase subunit 6 [Bannacoris arboreus]
MTIILTIFLINTMLFMMLNHPLSMGGMVIIQTIMASLMTLMIASTAMFPLILLIIMTSGMLVLFIYMSSVASNEKMKSSWKLFFSYMIISGLMYIIMPEMSNMHGNYFNIYIKNEEINLLKLFSYPSHYIIIMMVLYLMLTMIIVSFIATIKEGPLRTK